VPINSWPPIAGEGKSFGKVGYAYISGPVPLVRPRGGYSQATRSVLSIGSKMNGDGRPWLDVEKKVPRLKAKRQK
jgi:hypothetical protein